MRMRMRMKMKTRTRARATAALFTLCFSLGLALLGLRSAPAMAQSPLVIDDFTDVSDWSAHPADGVELSLSSDASDGDPAMRLDFHFEGGGYAIARHELALPLPENYAFQFRVRGECPSNHLEFKLVDQSGENVWWYVWRDVDFPRQETVFRLKKRKISFAWGPRGGGELDEVHAIEFAITAGSGGTGTVWIDDLELVPLPPADTGPLEVTAKASSNDAASAAVADGDAQTRWGSDPDDPTPWVELDLGRLYELNGFVLTWGDVVPSSYEVSLSETGDDWTDRLVVEGSNGGRDPLFLPDREARFVRVSSLGSAASAPTTTDRSNTPSMELAEIEVVPPERFPDREAFFHEIATNARRGLYPRGIYGEQAYWTVVGLDHDDHEVLVGEEGAVELWAGGPSLEPFLEIDGSLLTWADGEIETWLEDGYLPIPTIRRIHGGVALEITPFATGTQDNAEIRVRYRVTNRSATGDSTEGKLHLALRPFQVNPPSQSLNLKGGTARVSSLHGGVDGALLGGSRADRAGMVSLTFSPPAERTRTATFAEGDIVADYLELNRSGTSERSRGQDLGRGLDRGLGRGLDRGLGRGLGRGLDVSVRDPFEAASAAWTYPFRLAPGETREFFARFPLGTPSSNIATLSPVSIDSARTNRRLAEEIAHWHELLDRVGIDLPASGARYLETMRAQLGFILVNRSGPAIRPGVRSYARSWIRDGALTGAALLRSGHADAAREFLEWFAPHQYENGKIPCVVDHRGADPVPEHDSSGEFIFLVAEIYRFSGDEALAEEMWPRVLAAARYLDALRHERIAPEYETGDQRAFYGILPPSISHEGYSAKPMHSYWDDFFALKGFKDATFLAHELGRPEAVELEAITNEFSRDLGASVEASQEIHGIDYVPGCADLGDFDPTSTTIALDPVGAIGVVPRGDFETTFRRYLDFFRNRGDWEAYTPYEIRNVGAFVRLGWRSESHELMDFFFEDQRPAGWRSWAEVVSSHPREPRFIGDIPHTWVGSDYVRSFLDMFVDVDPDGQWATIGAGVPAAWLEGDGVRIRKLPTRFGVLDLEIRSSGENSAIVQLDGEAKTPPEGWRLDVPVGSNPATIRVNGKDVASAWPFVVRELPARVEIRW